MSNIDDQELGTRGMSGASETSANASGSGATGSNWSGTRATDTPPDSGIGGTASGNGSLGATDTSDQADELNRQMLQDAGLSEVEAAGD